MTEINFDGILMGIGKMIRMARTDMKLSVAELSEKAGVSVGVISDLENFKGRVPTLINFVKLANALNLPSTMFIDLFQDTISASNNIDTTEKQLRAALLNYGVDLCIIPHIIKYIDMMKESGMTMDTEGVNKRRDLF